MLTLLIIPVIGLVPETGEIYLEEDFETYPIGSFPSEMFYTYWGGWNIAQENTNKFLRSNLSPQGGNYLLFTQQNFPGNTLIEFTMRHVRDPQYGPVSVEMSMQKMVNNLYLGFYVRSDGLYGYTYWWEGQPTSIYVTLGNAPIAIQSGIWYDAKIVLEGSVAEFYVDDTFIIEFDVSTIGFTEIADFELTFSSWGQRDFDDLVVSQAIFDNEPPIITIDTPLIYSLYTVDSEEKFDFYALDNIDPTPDVIATLVDIAGNEITVYSGNYLPSVSGVYTLIVTATDDTSNSATKSTIFVVYDPNGGFATGGGWFIANEESTLPNGRANFGFVAKYKKDVSTGNLEFQYQDADINLKSQTIDWLTISNNKAIFQGTATLNDEGLFTFRIMATDNAEPGVDEDHFDIKIWEGTDTEADPVHKAKNIISGGNIKIHKK